jgi:hypothetical protein
MRPILELGSVIDREWRKKNYDDLLFPQLAAAALSRSDEWYSTSLDQIVEWFTSATDLPPQHLDGFGQPNVRVFANHKFRVELLFWFESTTSIHEHAFSGAFGVVSGSSLHTQYNFETTHRPCPELATGALTLRSSDLLRRGASHPIEPGASYIHSLFHLDYPSVSIVIRTHEDRRHTPQMRYARPGLAEAEQYDPYPHKAILAVLEAMGRISDALFARAAVSVIAEHDLLTAFRAARSVLRSSAAESVKKQVFERFAERDASLAHIMSEVVERQRRDGVLVAKRAEITDPEQRFLLALLLNIPDRSTILSLVSDRFPDVDPAHKVSTLFCDMASVLELPLRGKAAEMLETAISCSSLEAFLAVASASADVSGEALERVWRGLTGIPAFAPLFNGV